MTTRKTTSKCWYVEIASDGSYTATRTTLARECQPDRDNLHAPQGHYRVLAKTEAEAKGIVRANLNCGGRYVRTVVRQGMFCLVAN